MKRKSTEYPKNPYTTESEESALGYWRRHQKIGGNLKERELSRAQEGYQEHAKAFLEKHAIDLKSIPSPQPPDLEDIVIKVPYEQSKTEYTEGEWDKMQEIEEINPENSEQNIYNCENIYTPDVIENTTPDIIDNNTPTQALQEIDLESIDSGGDIQIDLGEAASMEEEASVQVIGENTTKVLTRYTQRLNEAQAEMTENTNNNNNNIAYSELTIPNTETINIGDENNGNNGNNGNNVNIDTNRNIDIDNTDEITNIYTEPDTPLQTQNTTQVKESPSEVSFFTYPPIPKVRMSEKEESESSVLPPGHQNCRM